jgi:LCP family protein required for cell wall assembly
MTNNEQMRQRRRSGEPVRHGRQKRHHPFATIVKIATAALGVVVVSSTSVAAIAAWDVASSVKPGIHLSHVAGQTPGPIPNVGAISGGVNLLLTGTDTRTGQGAAYSSPAELAGSSGVGSNDVTILLHIAQDHKSATIVSFPRDMIIPIPACQKTTGGTYPASSAAMLNTALYRGGLSCAVTTIESLTGLQIPFAAGISFDGVTAMSDAIGGVTVCLATPVNDLYTNPPLHLAAGQQTIVGPMALSFLRSRHGVGDGSDLGRISNQQVFMSALMRKIVTGGVLSNPFQLYPLAKAATSSMVLSDTLTSPTTLVQIALALKDTGLSNMVFLQYPVVADPSNPNRVIPQTSAASVLNAALVADQPVQLSGAPGRAAVVAPASPTAPAPAPTTTPGKASTAVPTPVPTATAPSNSVVLPQSVTGQTAAQQTCTKGN